MRHIPLLAALALTLSACASTGWPTEADASAMTDVPDHFVVIDPASGDSSEPAGPDCRNPMADPRDGSRLTLVRSSGGHGDYLPATPRYGLATNQLLRIRCSDGRPVGRVPDDDGIPRADGGPDRCPRELRR